MFLRTKVLAGVVAGLAISLPASASGVYAWCTGKSSSDGDNPGVVYVSPVKHMVPDARPAKVEFMVAVNKKFATKLSVHSLDCKSTELQDVSQQKREIELNLIRQGNPKKIETVAF